MGWRKIDIEEIDISRKSIIQGIKTIYNFVNSVIKNENGDLNIIGKLIKIIVIVILIRLGVRLVNRIIDKTFEKGKKYERTISDGRAKTLRNLLKNIVQKFLYFIGIITVLEMFNINTKSLLATAGIGGLAIGFGAQSLVKDIITGFFILLEDQFVVGDHISIGSFDGIVEDLGIRVTKIRDFSGELHIIPNGNIQIVTNKTRGAMRAVVEVEIAYEEDTENAIRVLNKLCKKIGKEDSTIIEGPEVLGVSNFAGSGVTIRIVAQTIALEQWNVERSIRKQVKETLESENIEIPYQKIVMYGGK